MTAEDVLGVLARLDAAGITWWIDGGWGVDALLGAETRPHDDLDLVIRRSDVERLASLFPEYSRAEQQWWPARFVLRDAAGHQLDFHPVTFDDDGDAWQELLDGTLACYPAGALRGRGLIGTREVRCITPELQLEHHDYAEGSPDDVDWQDVHALCKRFALAVPRGYELRPGFVDPKRSRGLLHSRPEQRQRQ